jgi:hypothetical protein
MRVCIDHSPSPAWLVQQGRSNCGSIPLSCIMHACTRYLPLPPDPHGAGRVERLRWAWKFQDWSWAGNTWTKCVVALGCPCPLGHTLAAGMAGQHETWDSNHSKLNILCTLAGRSKETLNFTNYSLALAFRSTNHTCFHYNFHVFEKFPLIYAIPLNKKSWIYGIIIFTCLKNLALYLYLRYFLHLRE